ncbi:MAG: hypothetical protein JKY11_08600 [Alphaproteobacteria bacterium]|nr:hypothetical protein [Alphaproteobacteria bacterium]
MRAFLTSPFWLFFYSFFIVSFLPYFSIRFGDQKWIYELLYRPNGIVENMTVLLYIVALCFSGWVLFKHKLRCASVIVAFCLAFFMFGEEIRWGLTLFVDDLHDVYITGMQDILIYVVKGSPEHFPLMLVGALFVARIVLFCIVGGIAISLWYYRHYWKRWARQARQYELSSHLVIYGVFLFGVIILELFIQPGIRKLDYIEETFELNAALIWLSFSYEAGVRALSMHTDTHTDEEEITLS